MINDMSHETREFEEGLKALEQAEGNSQNTDRLGNTAAEHTLNQRCLGWRLLPLSHPAAPIVTE